MGENKTDNELINLLDLISNSIECNTTLPAHVYELHKMYIFTVCQLSEDKIKGEISKNTEDLIAKLKYYCNTLNNDKI